MITFVGAGPGGAGPLCEAGTVWTGKRQDRPVLFLLYGDKTLGGTVDLLCGGR